MALGQREKGVDLHAVSLEMKGRGLAQTLDNSVRRHEAFQSTSLPKLRVRNARGFISACCMRALVVKQVCPIVRGRPADPLHELPFIATTAPEDHFADQIMLL